MNSNQLATEDLRRIVERASTHSGSLLASLLRFWSRRFPQPTVSELLDCSEEAVLRLAICKRPREESWVPDVQEIGQVIGIDRNRLEDFLRRAAVAERLALSNPAHDTTAGRLLAARDRDQE